MGFERSLRDDLDDDSARRELQLEARAHIRVQREIDALSSAGTYGEPASIERVRWLHREFYADASPHMLRVTRPDAEAVLAQMRALEDVRVLPALERLAEQPRRGLRTN